MEILDIYNKNKVKTGKIIKREVGYEFEEDEYCLIIQCWIINLNNEILMTRRALNKTFGGMWEPTSGCVRSGENSIQAVKRELSEEIGLKIEDENEINLIDTIIYENHTIKDMFILKKDIKINEIKFTDNEVIDAKFVSFEELKNMLNNGEAMQWLSEFIEIYEKL